MKIDPIRISKADVNNNGAFSTDYIGGSWDYPNASYAQRAEIWQAHKITMRACFYFLANDRQVPARLAGDEPVGLGKDEFTDTGALAAPVVHPRSAPHGRRVRDDAEGSANRADQAGPYRHGLLQQRLAQHGAHR